MACDGLSSCLMTTVPHCWLLLLLLMRPPIGLPTRAHGAAWQGPALFCATCNAAGPSGGHDARSRRALARCIVLQASCSCATGVQRWGQATTALGSFVPAWPIGCPRLSKGAPRTCCHTQDGVLTILERRAVGSAGAERPAAVRAQVPAGLEEAVCSLTQDEAAVFSCPAASCRGAPGGDFPLPADLEHVELHLTLLGLNEARRECAPVLDPHAGPEHGQQHATQQRQAAACQLSWWCHSWWHSIAVREPEGMHLQPRSVHGNRSQTQQCLWHLPALNSAPDPQSLIACRALGFRCLGMPAAGPAAEEDDLSRQQQWDHPGPKPSPNPPSKMYCLQVRDMTGDGQVVKRRTQQGRGQFPADCPIEDCAVSVHFRIHPAQGQVRTGPLLTRRQPRVCRAACTAPCTRPWGNS